MSIFLLIAGCGACSGKNTQDADTNDAADADAQEDQVNDEIVEDGAEDEGEATDAVAEINDGADMGPVDVAVDNEYFAELIGYQDLAFFMPSRPPTPCGEGCRQVSFAEHDVWSNNLEVWGNYLVINTLGGTSEEGYRKTIYLIELLSLRHYIVIETLAFSVLDPVVSYPSIDNGQVIYKLSLEDMYHYLMVFSIAPSIQNILLEITSSSATIIHTQIYDTQIYGNYVSWLSHVSGSENHVFLFDITARTEERISTESCFVCVDIDMHENHVAFISDNDGNDWPHVFVHDIETGTTEKVTTGNWAHMFPKVWGNVVVWTDTREGGDYVDYGMADIYMYNLTTREETAVCDHPASQVSGIIYENTIAWSDFRNDPEYPNGPTRATLNDIFIYDITSGEERMIDSVPRKKGVREIRGNKIYFLMEDDAGVLSVFEQSF